MTVCSLTPGLRADAAWLLRYLTRVAHIPVTRDGPVTRPRASRQKTKPLQSSVIRSMMPTATSILRESLEKHNETFETLLSFIPASYYLLYDDNSDHVCFHCLPHRVYSILLPQGASRYHKNKKMRYAPKQAIKEASKKARREKACSSMFMHARHTDHPWARSLIQRTIKAY
jgi:60S ribosome biogenesis protein Rrp14